MLPRMVELSAAAGEELLRGSLQSADPSSKARLQAALTHQWGDLRSAAEACADSKPAVRKFSAAISHFLNSSAGLLTLK